MGGSTLNQTVTLRFGIKSAMADNYCGSRRSNSATEPSMVGRTLIIAAVYVGMHMCAWPRLRGARARSWCGEEEECGQRPPYQTPDSDPVKRPSPGILQQGASKSIAE
jgi:hypothetical protein